MSKQSDSSSSSLSYGRCANNNPECEPHKISNREQSMTVHTQYSKYILSSAGNISTWQFTVLGYLKKVKANNLNFKLWHYNPEENS